MARAEDVWLTAALANLTGKFSWHVRSYPVWLRCEHKHFVLNSRLEAKLTSNVYETATTMYRTTGGFWVQGLLPIALVC